MKKKLPTPQKLPSGMWRCQVMVNGKRVSVVDESPAVAQAKAVALKNGLIEEKKSGPTMTVGQAIDRYIESKDAVLSPSTVAGYKRVRQNALQDLMQIKLSDLTQEDVQKAVNKMARERSPKSVRNAHGLLSATLAEYRTDMVLRTTLPQKQRHETAIPSDDDVEKIIAAAVGTEMELPILLAIWLGLRMSEILGLTEKDVDGDILHIRRARVDEGVKTTKTFSSQRDIPLPAHIKNLIEQSGKNREYVVPFTRRSIYSRFQTICKHAGVQHYRFHDLRHINASIMLALGVPDKYAMERMGHATNNMLKTVYQHTMKSKQNEVASMVDNYFMKKLHTNLHTDNKKP